MTENERRQSQADFIFSYFQDHPNEDLTTASVVDWATEEWYRRNASRLKDPDRAIRKLAETGLVQQLAKGLYRYTPNHIVPVEDRPKPKSRGVGSGPKNRICAACGFGNETSTAVETVSISNSTAATISLCRKHADMYRRSGVLDFCTRYFTAISTEASARGDSELADLCRRLISEIAAFTFANTD
jgi:hypothetical protein